MRRRTEEEHDNKERWLVSYADFITLLFAFFVVMYSISSVNEGKYKVLSESLEGVFSSSQKTIEPIQVGDVVPRSESDNFGSRHIQPILGIPSPESKETPKTDDTDMQLEMVAGEFRESFEDLIFEDKVTIQTRDDWIEISLDDTLVFASGGTEPAYEAFPVMEKIAGILRNFDNAMLVEGHTDNLPIKNSVYPSNWELSAARAATVVRFLALEGVSPDRMGAMGYGEFKPIARNDTDIGRNKNRRVVLLISKAKDIRESLLN